MRSPLIEGKQGRPAGPNGYQDWYNLGIPLTGKDLSHQWSTEGA
jgi:hypothetical protein